jgi:hypothetical protein
MARIWIWRLESAWEEDMSREGVRGVRKTGSTRVRREGEERRFCFVNWRASRRIRAKRDATGVFDIVVVSLGLDSVVNVEDTEREKARMCWLDELTLRGAIAGAIDNRAGRRALSKGR